ncbi:MAG: hypothetical protein M1305_06360 [Candidatus Marsarchaeota archaeon]|nr:hypothetical protein [Candidatus Marsarchaeota archaeon]
MTGLSSGKRSKGRAKDEDRREALKSWGGRGAAVSDGDDYLPLQGGI